MTVNADVAVIGGTGLYTLLPGGERAEVDTPYGQTSGPITIHDVDGVRVAFLARHGEHHQYPAHRVPYRANLWALASLGVTRVIAPCAVGSLRPELEPGALVVPSQIIDRTSDRVATFYDHATVHVGFAEPYCPQLRSSLAKLVLTNTNSTLVVVSGPRFATKAESAWHRHSGGDLVNMTAMPEAVLARELALCYANLAVVTDYDAGLETHSPVTQTQVMARFAASLDHVRTVLMRCIAAVAGSIRTCPCPTALDGLGAPALVPQFVAG